MGHASSDHGAKSRIIEPSFWFVVGPCGVGLLLCLKCQYNSQMADGSLMNKQEKQIEFRAKRKLRHEMAKRYNDKIRHFANKRYGHDDCRHERGHSHCRAYNKSRPYKRNDRDKNCSFRRNDRTHKAPPQAQGQGLRGTALSHSWAEESTFVRQVLQKSKKSGQVFSRQKAQPQSALQGRTRSN